MSPVACSACAWSKAEQRMLFLLPSLSPASLPQRCRQAGKALCVLISVSFVWGTKLPPQFGAGRAVCKTRLPSISPRGWPQLPIWRHRRDPRCAEALHSSLYLVLVSSFSPSLGDGSMPRHGAWGCSVYPDSPCHFRCLGQRTPHGQC